MRHYVTLGKKAHDVTWGTVPQPSLEMS